MSIEIDLGSISQNTLDYRRKWLHPNEAPTAFDELIEWLVSAPGFLTSHEREIFYAEVRKYERKSHKSFKFGEAYEEANGLAVLTFGAIEPTIEFMEFMGILNKCFKRAWAYQEKAKKNPQKNMARFS